MATKRESRLQRRIRKRLEAAFPRSHWFKVHGGPFQPAGLPDLVGCVEGRYCGLEVKRPGERASPVQRATIARLKRAGAISGVVTSVAEAIATVRAGLAE